MTGILALGFALALAGCDLFGEEEPAKFPESFEGVWHEDTTLWPYDLIFTGTAVRQDKPVTLVPASSQTFKLTEVSGSRYTVKRDGGTYTFTANWSSTAGIETITISNSSNYLFGGVWPSTYNRME
jgi:hypothetical protein